MKTVPSMAGICTGNTTSNMCNRLTAAKLVTVDITAAKIRITEIPVAVRKLEPKIESLKFLLFREKTPPIAPNPEPTIFNKLIDQYNGSETLAHGITETFETIRIKAKVKPMISAMHAETSVNIPPAAGNLVSFIPRFNGLEQDGQYVAPSSFIFRPQ